MLLFLFTLQSQVAFGCDYGHSLEDEHGGATPDVGVAPRISLSRVPKETNLERLETAEKMEVYHHKLQRLHHESNARMAQLRRGKTCSRRGNVDSGNLRICPCIWFSSSCKEA